MGFDNECILNIQSLAGEYFCPVCRLLVYPNEALQSQCTHLYCKPCLTYVVNTTQACPYDGYLVTEADSKPLVESNKGLAETIGKITVYCLFHRSGCTWQGPLSECTAHGSGCAFGSSPVICNRCAIQIVHRQVQEHAQNCPGVQPQASQAEVAHVAASGTEATTDQTQAATQAGSTSQVQTQTTATLPPGKDAHQQPIVSQSSTAVQAAAPTAEQWYQQQQQYQQYYQQYPGYIPYQQQYQQYYPYQQHAVPQYQQPHLSVQPQVYVQPEAQSQHQMQPQAQVQAPSQSQPQLQSSHPHVQATVAAQPQNQAQVNQQQQSHPLQLGQLLPQAQSYPQAQAQPYPQAQPPQPHPMHPHPQHMQMPPYQQPQSQAQHTQNQIQHPVPQSQPQSLQTQVQHHPQPPLHHQAHPSLLNRSQAHPQAQPHQQIPSSGPPQYPMYVHPQTGAQSHLQNQFPQKTPSMHPPQSHVSVPNQAQPALLPAQGQVANAPPAQQLPVRPHAPQHGVPVSQHLGMQPVQQPIPNQYVQNQPPFAGQHQPPFAGQHQQGHFVQQQLPGHSQLRPQGPSQSFQHHSHAYSKSQPHQPQNVGQSLTPNHGVHSHSYQQSVSSVQGQPAQLVADQSSSNQSNLYWTNNQVQLSSENQGGATSKPEMSDKQEIAVKIAREREAESSEKTANNGNLDAVSGPQAAADGMKVSISETDVKSMVDEIKTETKEKTSAFDSDSHAAGNVHPLKKMVKEEVPENVDWKGSANHDINQEEHSVSNEGQDGSFHKATPMQKCVQLGEQSEKRHQEQKLPQAQGIQGPGIVPPAGQMQTGGFLHPSSSLYGASALQQRPATPSLFQAPTLGAANQPQAPSQFRPPVFKPHESKIPPGGIPISDPAVSFGRGPGQRVFELPSVAPQGPYEPGHSLPSHVGTSRISHGDPVGGRPLRSVQPSAFDSHGGMRVGGLAYGPEGELGRNRHNNLIDAETLRNQRPGYMDGRQSESHFSGSVKWSPLGPPSGIQSNMMRINGGPGPELQDERFKSFPDERFNSFPMDPARHIIYRGEFEDLKQFPRPSHLDAESLPRHGGHFLLSGPFDRGSHGFTMDMGPRPFGRGLNYDPSLKVDPVGGSAPSRFLSSYHDDSGGVSDSSHAHPDFPKPGHAYGRHHIGGLSPRNSFREFRGFGGFPGSLAGSRSVRDDIDDREFRRFGDPAGNSFRESRFPVLPSHLHRGEFEGSGRTGDLISQDFIPSHSRKGHPLGLRHIRSGETASLGGFPGPARMGDFGGPRNFSSPRLGEPGFRSSFSRQFLPTDGGLNTGDKDPFDHPRKRKPPSMGWCRICKVDCETVDGLDLHSQTREHQKMAMDMVVSIKQNAKKQKLTSSDHGSIDDANK